MKILELRFKNLNSLYGEWFIDFSVPEYAANGIFALTGPTGAGKSTILDAICLALYGATPRLGKITRSSNEIMSRQTGECYAEVRFQSREGLFLCHWSQHRARRKAGGDLQNPRHEIADGVTGGRVIEHQLRRVAAVIEEKTGMDFERFTRSVLLAQGGFDTFLKAEVEQKSRILEQITGTEIYTKISQRVHERQRDERDKLNRLQDEMAGVVILAPAQEKELDEELREKIKKEKDINAKLMETGKALTWLSGVQRLRHEISSLSVEGDKLKAEFESFKPARERLARALKAAEMDGQYALLTSVRKEQGADQKSLRDGEKRLPAFELLVQQKKDILQKAESLTLKVREEQKKAVPLIRKVRSLDLQLAEKKKIVDSEDETCRRNNKQIESDRKLKAAVEKKYSAALESLKVVEKYLAVNSRDAWLVGGLTGVEEQLVSLLSVQQDITDKKESEANAQARLKAADKKLTSRVVALNIRKQALDKVKKQLERRKDDSAVLLAGRLLREYRREKETLLREEAFRRKIADLESERVRLEDGKPCPLCGAGEHPFALGNIPEVDEIGRKIEKLTELIRKAEGLEAAVKELETAEKDIIKKLTDCERLEAAAVNEQKTAARYLEDITGELKKTTLCFAGLRESVLNRLRPLGIEKITDTDLPALLTSLRKRLNRWQEQQSRKVDIAEQVTELAGRLKSLDAVIEARSQALLERQIALGVIKKEFAGGKAKRRELFGAKSPETEERRLEEAVSAAELGEKSARTACDAAGQRLNSARANIILLKERVNKRAFELKVLESEFLDAVKTAGFADEQQFLAARLPLPERDILQARARDLDDRQTDLRARQKDRQNQLIIENDKKVTEARLEELEPVYRELEEGLSLLRAEIAEVRHRLTENAAAKERIKKKQSVIEIQKKECRRWEKLHALIGSADGKKYRNFAQGLTFEIMVLQANRQLEKMTDRYLLIRDNKQPLELNVIDNYQAGEIRSIKNLSGGESFIVSLTLALGLSKMASRKVRVDSLFLDEGFGTLDEEALDAALEALGGLQQDGKLIGVISHVPALKERIRAQINILPVSGGRSIVSGPGCERIK
ncbi:AAA family ATPase [Desulfobacterota bacterium M19]